MLEVVRLAGIIQKAAGACSIGGTSLQPQAAMPTYHKELERLHPEENEPEPSSATVSRQPD